MDIEKMSFEEVEARLAAILNELENEDADVDALKAETDGLRARRQFLEERAEAKRNLRASIAEMPARVVETFTPTPTKEERKQEGPTMEFRNTKQYIDAFAEMIKTGDDTEVRALLTENGGGEVAIPDIVADRIAAAWQRDEIMQRINRVFVKGNYTIGYEISGTDAVIHVEGAAAPTEETLTLGKVTLVPANLKKWISVTDEVMDLKGERFLNYLYDEIEYKIVKLAGQVVIACIVAAAADGGSTMPYVASVSANLSATSVVDLEAQILADEASDLVAIMTRSTYAQLRGLQISSGQNVGDIFDGLPHVLVAEDQTNGLHDYAAGLTAGDPYLIVGDLAGVTANFPNGDDVKFTFDEYTLAPEDLIRIIGRLFVGIGVTAPGFFAVAVKA